MSRPSTRTRISLFWGALLFAAGASGPPVHAADQKAILAKVKARYEAAATAYDDGQLEKAETQLKQALKLAEDNGLGENKASSTSARRSTSARPFRYRPRWPPRRS